MRDWLPDGCAFVCAQTHPDHHTIRNHLSDRADDKQRLNTSIDGIMGNVHEPEAVFPDSDYLVIFRGCKACANAAG